MRWWAALRISLLPGPVTTIYFPLWYEERLAGLLLVDPSPRAYLDEDEAILWGLGPQISHTIESCRLAGAKNQSRESTRSQRTLGLSRTNGRHHCARSQESSQLDQDARAAHARGWGIE